MRRLEQLLGFDRNFLNRIGSKAGRYYFPFDIKKSDLDPKLRHIDNPVKLLKIIQRKIHRSLLSTIQMPSTMLGGVVGCSIRQNAEYHVGQELVVTLDLKSCFPRTHDTRIFQVFKTLGCSTDISALLTKLTTFQHRLPQGAPTSSLLANLTLLPLHNEIQELVVSLGIRCTFWVDDITLSGKRADLSSDVIEKVVRLIQIHGHAVSRKKFNFMPVSGRQEANNIKINKRIGPTRKRLERIRKQILGLNSLPTGTIFSCDLQSLKGKISYVKYLDPNAGERLEKFADRLLPQTGLEDKKERETLRVPCHSTDHHRQARFKRKHDWLTDRRALIATDQKQLIFALLRQREEEIAAGIGHDLDDVLAEADALIQSPSSNQS